MKYNFIKLFLNKNLLYILNHFEFIYIKWKIKQVISKNTEFIFIFFIEHILSSI